LDPTVLIAMLWVSLCLLKVILLLKVQPELWGYVEEPAEANCGIRRHGTISVEYLLDTGLMNSNRFVRRYGVIPRGPRNSSRRTSPG